MHGLLRIGCNSAENLAIQRTHRADRRACIACNHRVKRRALIEESLRANALRLHESRTRVGLTPCHKLRCGKIMLREFIGRQVHATSREIFSDVTQYVRLLKGDTAQRREMSCVRTN